MNATTPPVSWDDDFAEADIGGPFETKSEFPTMEYQWDSPVHDSNAGLSTSYKMEETEGVSTYEDKTNSIPLEGPPTNTIDIDIANVSVIIYI